MKYSDDMDPECIKICDTLNSIPGIKTIESCCGHGKVPFNIFLIAKSLTPLPVIAYALDFCHSGCLGWRLLAYTDCGMCPIRFNIEGPIISDWNDVDKIIKVLQETIKDSYTK